MSRDARVVIEPYAIDVQTRDVHLRAIANMLLSRRYHQERAEKALDEISELILFPELRNRATDESIGVYVRAYQCAVDSAASCDRAMDAHRWALTQASDDD